MGTNYWCLQEIWHDVGIRWWVQVPRMRRHRQFWWLYGRRWTLRLPVLWRTTLVMPSWPEYVFKLFTYCGENKNSSRSHKSALVGALPHLRDQYPSLLKDKEPKTIGCECAYASPRGWCCSMGNRWLFQSLEPCTQVQKWEASQDGLSYNIFRHIQQVTSIGAWCYRFESCPLHHVAVAQLVERKQQKMCLVYRIYQILFKTQLQQ